MNERDRRIGEMLGAGVSRSEIARQLGIDRGTVVRVAIRLGFGARVREPEAGWETIRAHYDAGNSAENCRRLFRISEGAWEMAVARGEIVPRPHNEPIGARGETRRKVAARRAEGFTVSEVAETLRVSKPTVCHHARKLGIPPGRSKRRYDWSAIRGGLRLGALGQAMHGSVRLLHQRMGGCSEARSGGTETCCDATQ